MEEFEKASRMKLPKQRVSKDVLDVLWRKKGGAITPDTKKDHKHKKRVLEEELCYEE